jgi:hypothetical protein
MIETNIVNLTDIIDSLDRQVNKKKVAYNLLINFTKECVHIILNTKYGFYAEENIYFSFQKEPKEFIDYVIYDGLRRLHDKTFNR